MLFRQLFDRDSCTYTYLLADEQQAVLIDPVLGQVDRDAQILAELSLELLFTLETHIHADHITGAAMLRDRLGSQTVVSEAGEAECADRAVNHGDEIRFGGRHLSILATPGHTSTCVSYLLDDKSMVFTGDALLVRGCGRTDFQCGDSATLYQSVHSQILTLPARCRVYPGHDYQGRTMTTVAEELTHNPRLGGGRTVDQFIEIMDQLNLAQPAKIDIAVPANQKCGAPEG
jgi:glyoxylase-like metal-dependent hydrolase (beta-lactamase superfamily II)